MDINGENKKRLTNQVNDFYHPVVSPDGDKVAFQSFDRSWLDIYLMNIDGSNLMNLGRGREAQFSPDSKQIVFVNRSDVWMIDITTMEKTNLTNDPFNYL